MANARLSLEAEDNKFNDFCRNKLSQDQSVNMAALKQWQNFSIIQLKIVFLFLLKWERFCI